MSNATPDKKQLTDQAKAVLSGQAIEPRALRDLAKQLKNLDEFGYARKLLDRARKLQEAEWTPAERLDLAQRHALATYKDPDLPTDQKFARALAILQEEDDLKTSTNQQTLGLAGAIYKRMWEVNGSRRHLGRSLGFYLRGYQQGISTDPANDSGWTAINAAFVLDLLADQEEEDARESRIESLSAQNRRAHAQTIRRELIEKLAVPARLTADWWVSATVAEAHFGLGEYSKAGEWLERAMKIGGNAEWGYQTTLQQLAALARLRQRGLDTPAQAEQARNVLKEFLQSRDIKNIEAAVDGAYVGKVGLALSGGGFRASLFHIGVLAKLADIGILHRVEALSCVSGGSIIGAYYYLQLRKLFKEKPSDAAFTSGDYVQVVREIERDFLAGVQKNIRTRVVGGWWSNVKMIFWPNYSRTMRVGELYEQHLYSRIEDEEGDEPRYLNRLCIVPQDEAEGFSPKRDNWQRRHKVPILILNATSLNTGHVWQFTASYMGEPPWAINTEIDANDRLRRMYYGDAPQQHQQVRLGYAVASSSCVPGMFEPIALPELYPQRTIRLVDGGVFDNQGAASLLEQDCSILLVSDASGQLTSENEPGSDILAVVGRSSSISQERIRWVQHRELEARRRSGLLRALMYIHLKKDLETDPVDWIDCPDPYDSTADARPPELRGPLTRYGVRKDMQRLLSGVRTDLDSFADGEAYALMASGYFMTEYEFAKCVTAFPDLTPADLTRRSAWRFLALEESLKQPGRDEKLKRLLTTASQLAFKIWQLSRTLRLVRSLTGTAVLAALAAGILWLLKHPQQATSLINGAWDYQLLSLGIGPSYVMALKLGWVLSFLITMALIRMIGSRAVKVADWRWTLIKMSIGLVMSTLGWLVVRLHLWIFDQWYLRWGRRKHVIEPE